MKNIIWFVVVCAGVFLFFLGLCGNLNTIYSSIEPVSKSVPVATFFYKGIPCKVADTAYIGKHLNRYYSMMGRDTIISPERARIDSFFVKIAEKIKILQAMSIDELMRKYDRLDSKSKEAREINIILIGKYKESCKDKGIEGTREGFGEWLVLHKPADVI